MTRVKITFTDGTSRELTLPDRYQSDQFMQDFCDTLCDAQEIECAGYLICERD